MAEMDRIRGRLNPDITLTGIVVGRMNRTNHARDVAVTLRAAHGRDVIEETIRDSIRVPEAAAAGMAVTAYAPSSAVAADFRALTIEIIHRDPSAQPDEAEGQPAWRGLFDRLVGSRS
jgi:chromosome partitioning protein